MKIDNKELIKIEEEIKQLNIKANLLNNKFFDEVEELFCKYKIVNVSFKAEHVTYKLENQIFTGIEDDHIIVQDFKSSARVNIEFSELIEISGVK